MISEQRMSGFGWREVTASRMASFTIWDLMSLSREVSRKIGSDSAIGAHARLSGDGVGQFLFLRA
jgi:hypothetical protein